ncbi:MAG: efflux RND transporter periplasmic adaptor subunit [Deltaproteobacteria bacterium]|jgi:Cu(I)/Ag(I) efflux system membrane fusion protein|nr:efflux RND transporter periplasmic adaptor subunit [Deltaproteobacteria bacterium]
MVSKNLGLIILGLILGGLLGFFGGPYLVDAGKTDSPAQAAAPPSDVAAEAEILYWYDPMFPGTRFDQPGKSPFMDMELVPRYADASGGAGVVIDPVQIQNLGVKVTEAKAGRLTRTRMVSANVEFNRYLEARVQPRAEGFVSEISRLAVGDTVKLGQEIAKITVPAWASDQSEYLLLKSQRADPKLIGGVREKLRLNGMPEEMLAEVDATGKVQTTLRILAPVAGAVTELNVYPGMNVEKNMTVAVILGFDPVWVTAEVPEGDLELAQNGRARVAVPAYPGELFEPSDRSVLARASLETRTVPLRLTVPNPEGRLKPGFTATVRLRGQGPEGLIIPSQSLIDLGSEKRVITRAPDGSFVPKLVTVGGASGEETVVTSGLSENDQVVVSGLFLIDSEANLTGALERMRRTPQTPESAADLPAPAAPSAPAAPAAPAGHDHGQNS